MSEIKVNKITPRVACGTTQLGDSGDTFTIPAGATINNLGTASGFGATGAVNWDVASIKTVDFTAVSGNGYFVDTATTGAVEVTLPAAPSVGDVVGVSDYANNFANANCTLNRNSLKIGGVATNSDLTTNGVAVTLVYVDVTKGWIVTDSGNQSDAPVPSFVAATGGCIKTSGDFKTHIFTSPGTFAVSSAGNSAGSNTADYFIIAGGGGGGSAGGGGGAGGFRLSNSVGGLPAPTMSPLISCTGFSVAATPYPVVVGGGGNGGPASNDGGTRGVASSVFCFTSAGGGAGAGHGNQPPYPTVLTPGGSGGGGGNAAGAPGWGPAGTGNDPSVSPPQGFPGGGGSTAPCGGCSGSGGGASAAGASVPAAGSAGGDGSFIADALFGPTAPSYGTPGPTPSTRYFAGGGGNANSAPTPGAGGAGGGGPGKACTGSDGTVNTGGGGGASDWALGTTDGGGGGSGIVMIRYKYQ